MIRDAEVGRGLRLALVAAVGAWAGGAFLGSRFGSVLGAGGAVLLVETGIGRSLTTEAVRLIRAGAIPPLASRLQQHPIIDAVPVEN